MIRAKVFVLPKRDVMDPQGLAIKHALETLGFRMIGRVNQGKYFVIEFDSKNKKQVEQHLAQICRDVLSNPVIEDFSYEIS
jgi:phosphoribosylformylglycinamidine synthase PurS subunit